MSARDTRTIGVEEIGGRVREHLQHADKGRAEGLAELSGLQKAKQAVRRRERRRLVERYGAEDIRVERLEHKLAAGDDLIAAAAMEVDRLRATECDVREGEWVLRGHVRGLDAWGVAGITVALSDDPCRVDKPLATTRTGENGDFELRRMPEPAGEQGQEAQPEQLWLHVLDREGKSIHTDPQPLWEIPNVLDYRNEQLALGPEDLEEAKRPRFLGNANTMELHDLSKAGPQCRIDAIRTAYRRPFDSREAAQEQEFDLCANCFGKEESRR